MATTVAQRDKAFLDKRATFPFPSRALQLWVRIGAIHSPRQNP